SHSLSLSLPASIRSHNHFAIAHSYFTMSSPRSSRTTSENEREGIGSQRILPMGFVLPSSSSSDLESVSYPPPPPPPRKRILTAPLPTNSKVKRTLIFPPRPAGGENEERRDEGTGNGRAARAALSETLPRRQSYPRSAKRTAAVAAPPAKKHKSPKKN
ncbi:hypothetical protein PFISCL1PPCAC_27021, partial [Pristionchus fissidentatus]